MFIVVNDKNRVLFVGRNKPIAVSNGLRVIPYYGLIPEKESAKDILEYDGKIVSVRKEESK